MAAPSRTIPGLVHCCTHSARMSSAAAAGAVYADSVANAMLL